MGRRPRTRRSTWRSAAAWRRAAGGTAAWPAAERRRRRIGGAGRGDRRRVRDRRRLQERPLLRQHLLPIGLRGPLPVLRAAGQRRHLHERAGRPDPRNECPDDGVAGCMRDGFCDGTGACAVYARGTICKPQSCAASTVTFAGLCDGDGRVRRGHQQFVRPVPVRQRREVSIELRDHRRLRGGRGVRERKLRAEAAGRAVHDGQRVRVDELRAGRLLHDRVRGNVQVVRDRGQRRRVHRRSERRRSAVAVRGRGRDDLRQRRNLRRRGRVPARTRARRPARRRRAPVRRRRRRAPATAPASA